LELASKVKEKLLTGSFFYKLWVVGGLGLAWLFWFAKRWLVWRANQMCQRHWLKLFFKSALGKF
jgi:hypothetical protein